MLRYLLLATILGANFCPHRPHPIQESSTITLRKGEYLQGDGKKLLPILFDGYAYYDVTVSNGPWTDVSVVIDVWVKGKKSKSFPASVLHLDEALYKEGKTGVFIGSSTSPFSPNKILLTIIAPEAGDVKIKKLIELDEFKQQVVVDSLPSVSSSLLIGTPFPIQPGEMKAVYGVFYAKRIESATDLPRSAEASELAIVVSLKPVKAK